MDNKQPNPGDEEQQKEVIKDTRPTTEDVQNKKGLKFTDMGLKHDLLLGIVDKNFHDPSPVQEECIPLALAGQNIVARAKNGTGQTAAFLIPVLEQVDTQINKVQGLILVPTRELALQISAEVKTLGKYMNIQCVVSTGGTDYKDDIFRLEQTVHVVVGTPGRIMDFVNRKIMDLTNCNVIVLDEADKLLSVDFQPIIERIFSNSRSDCQKLLFSATFPSEISQFISSHVPDAKMINLMDELTLQGVTQYYVYLEEKDKVSYLNILNSKLNINQCIIFCNSVQRVELLAQQIQENYSCFYIHAQMPQNDRNKAFHEFRQGQGRCLVSSDLFTRGIDIQTVNVVFNFDFPKNTETYLHRIGRSGRFGHLGLAINFVTDADTENIVRVEQSLGIEILNMPKQVDKSLY